MCLLLVFSLACLLGKRRGFTVGMPLQRCVVPSNPPSAALWSHSLLLSPFLSLYNLQVINKFNAGTNNAFNWHVALSQWIPSYGRDINAEPGLYDKVMSKARAVLLEGKTSGYRTGMQHSNHLFDRIDMDSDGVLSPTEISSYLTRHTSMHPTQIEVLHPAPPQFPTTFVKKRDGYPHRYKKHAA